MDPETLARLQAAQAGGIPDDVLARLKAAQPNAPAPEQGGFWNTTKDVAKSLGSGIVRGLGEAAMTPLTLKETGDWLAQGAMNKADQGVRYLFGLGDVSPELQAKRDAGLSPSKADQLGQSVTGAVHGIEDAYLPKPQTTAGQYAQTAGEFIPMAAAGGEGLLARGANALRYGIAPALVSETAGQATKGTKYEKAARLAGAILGGGAGSLAEGASSVSQRLAGRAGAGVTPAQWDAAANLMQRAQAAGVPLTTAEAIQQVTNGATNFGGLQRLVESQGTGAERMSPFLAQRPGQIQGAVGNVMDQIAPRSATPSMQGVQLQEGAQGALDTVRQRINASSEPYYQAAQTDRVSPAILHVPGFQDTLAAVRADPILSRYIQGLPDDSAVVADFVRQQMGQAAENAANPMNLARNRQREAAMNADVANVGQLATQASPDLQQALQMQAAGRQQALAPLEAGPLGQVARTPEVTGQASALLPKNPLVGAAQETDLAARHLMAQNPQATQGVVRQALETEANKALAPRGGAQENMYGGARFANSIRGNPERNAVANALMGATTPQATQTAMTDLLDALQATGHRQPIGSRTAFNKEALEELGSGGVAGATKLAANPFASTREALTRWRLGGQTNTLADLLLEPNGLARLRQLAGRNNASPVRAEIVRLLTQGGNTLLGAP